MNGILEVDLPVICAIEINRLVLVDKQIWTMATARTDRIHRTWTRQETVEIETVVVENVATVTKVRVIYKKWRIEIVTGIIRRTSTQVQIFIGDWCFVYFEIQTYCYDADKRDRRGERDAEHRTNPKNHDRIRDHRGTLHSDAAIQPQFIDRISSKTSFCFLTVFQMVIVIGMTEKEIGEVAEVIETETGNGLELVIGVNMLARRAKSITIIVRRRFLNGKNQRNG